MVLAIPYDLATAPPSDAASRWKPAARKARLARRAGGTRPRRRSCSPRERPLVLAGRGVLLGHAAAPLRDVGDRLGALFMTSVMAANAFDSPWDLGIAGGFTRGHRLNVARQADLVLVVGPA